MPHRTAVILIVGLNQSLLRHMPRLSAFAKRGELRTLDPVLPAVTCSVQSSMLTGLPVSSSTTSGGHGIVGNGWFHRELAEVHFWKQSNRLVHGEKVWETARRRDPSVTTANLFWWFNMYSSVDYAVTPRPIYKADGRKIPDCYTEPADLRDRLQTELGRFPLFHFWGPGASIASSRWIAEAALRVHRWHNPTLNLVYLPHLDYALQKYGPDDPRSFAAAKEIDETAANLIDTFESDGVRVLVVSEYGIEPVNQPVHINRALRDAGLLRVRTEDDRELLDPGAGDAFAVADHQIAHVYVNPARKTPHDVAAVCRAVPGVEAVLDRPSQKSLGLDHDHAGDLVLIASHCSWFTYYYWLDDARAPDFARTVDIHRKPGYDPAELFIDPTIAFPKLAIASRLLKRSMGMRTLMDVIPLDATLVKGSHGRIEQPADIKPVLITPGRLKEERRSLPCTAVRDVILAQLFDQ